MPHLVFRPRRPDHSRTPGDRRRAGCEDRVGAGALAPREEGRGVSAGSCPETQQLPRSQFLEANLEGGGAPGAQIAAPEAPAAGFVVLRLPLS